MSRVSFASNIDFNVPIEHAIMGYFDELMTLYDLVCEYTSFKIEGTICDMESISFNMIFDTKAIAEDVSGKLNNKSISKYNRDFVCNTQHDSSNVLKVRLVS